MMTGIDGSTESAREYKKSREFFINYTLAVNTLFHFGCSFFSTGTGISPAWNQTWHMVHLIVMHNENGN